MRSSHLFSLENMRARYHMRARILFCSRWCFLVVGKSVSPYDDKQAHTFTNVYKQVCKPFVKSTVNMS